MPKLNPSDVPSSTFREIFDETQRAMLVASVEEKIARLESDIKRGPRGEKESSKSTLEKKSDKLREYQRLLELLVQESF